MHTVWKVPQNWTLHPPLLVKHCVDERFPCSFSFSSTVFLNITVRHRVSSCWSCFSLTLSCCSVIFFSCSEDIVSSSLRLFKHQQALQAGWKQQCWNFFGLTVYIMYLTNSWSSDIWYLHIFQYFLNSLLKKTFHLKCFLMFDPLHGKIITLSSSPQKCLFKFFVSNFNGTAISYFVCGHRIIE